MCGLRATLPKCLTAKQMRNMTLYRTAKNQPDDTPNRLHAVYLHFHTCAHPQRWHQVLHHWWGPLPTRGVTEPREKLDCTAARQRIYVPAYHFVLEHKVQHIVKQLAQEASRHGLVLLDYGTNADMADPTMPLAHASVLRQYILDNFEALMRA